MFFFFFFLEKLKRQNNTEATCISSLFCVGVVAQVWDHWAELEVGTWRRDQGLDEESGDPINCTQWTGRVAPQSRRIMPRIHFPVSAVSLPESWLAFSFFLSVLFLCFTLCLLLLSAIVVLLFIFASSPWSNRYGWEGVENNNQNPQQFPLNSVKCVNKDGGEEEKERP